MFTTTGGNKALTVVLLVVLMLWSTYLASFHAPHSIFAVVSFVLLLMFYLYWVLRERIFLTVMSLLPLYCMTGISVLFRCVGENNSVLVLLADILAIVALVSMSLLLYKKSSVRNP
ncbi:hypothetical protein ACN08Z_07785 [Rothia sp. P7181]|uniref:hypothetical protein n=1 Tax=Rothia sp. P7181 TaxID=3402663 RepID=UPI003ADFE72E